jgi:hypothetical protein
MIAETMTVINRSPVPGCSEVERWIAQIQWVRLGWALTISDTVLIVNAT